MAKTTYPLVVVVDKYDKEIGVAPLTEVWQKGLYHRIVSVFVKDIEGRMLLQLRAPNVKMYPNCWDQAAGGHVDQGFDYEQTAKNELYEELGIQNVTLETRGTFSSTKTMEDGRIINQFERVYLVQVPSNITLHIDPEEIYKVQWFTPNELKEQIKKNPELFTSGFLYAVKNYFPEF